jgi:hypothetical protein
MSVWLMNLARYPTTGVALPLSNDLIRVQMTMVVAPALLRGALSRLGALNVVSRCQHSS